jgi:hydrogenase maturation protease
MNAPSRAVSAPPTRTGRRTARPRGTIAVDVLACGRPGCGDDALGTVVAGALGTLLSSETTVRVVGRLGIDDLLGLAPSAGVVVVDTVDGVRGGRVVRMPLDEVVAHADDVRLRGSAALAFPEVLGLTGMIRGHPLRGEVVLVGGVHYGAGSDLSPSVRRAVPKAVAAVRAACLALRDGSIAVSAANQPSE